MALHLRTPNRIGRRSIPLVKSATGRPVQNPETWLSVTRPGPIKSTGSQLSGSHLKKRRTYQPAKQPPPSGDNPAHPNRHPANQEIDSFSELFDEDGLDFLDNSARSPKERHHTDLLAIGLLLLLCALLVILVMIIMHYRHSAGPQKITQVAPSTIAQMLPTWHTPALSEAHPTSRPSYAKPASMFCPTFILQRSGYIIGRSENREH